MRGRPLFVQTSVFEPSLPRKAFPLHVFPLSFLAAFSAALTLERLMMREGPCPHKGCPGTESEAHSHYLNLINPEYRRVGIGLVQRGHMLSLTEDFLS